MRRALRAIIKNGSQKSSHLHAVLLVEVVSSLKWHDGDGLDLTLAKPAKVSRRWLMPFHYVDAWIPS